MIIKSSTNNLDASSFGLGYDDKFDLFLQLCIVKTKLALILSDFGRCSSIVIDPFEVVVQIDSFSPSTLLTNPNIIKYDAKQVENLMNNLVPSTSIFVGEDWAFRYHGNDDLPLRFTKTNHFIV